MEGLKTQTHPISRISHCAKNKVNDSMGASTFGFSGITRRRGATICSKNIIKACMSTHELSGYSHTSLLSTPLYVVSTAKPNINKFATNTAMSEAGCPYMGTHRFGPRQLVIFSQQPLISVLCIYKVKERAFDTGNFLSGKFATASPFLNLLKSSAVLSLSLHIHL